jgi:molybdenum cofactor cytidylyltransferase
VRFGTVAVGDCAGWILAHGVKRHSLAFVKGRVLSEADAAALAGAGIETVTAARLDPDDLGEDEAATRVAQALAGSGATLTVAAAFTGRVNLFAAGPGLFQVDRARLDAINRVDEAITVATLAPLALVGAGQMVATIKIIPFAAPRTAVARCAAIAAGGPLRAGLIQTRLPGLKDSVHDKTAAVTRDRLAGLGGHLVDERRVDHTPAAVAAAMGEVLAAGADPVLIAGASAITDRRDVLPAGIVAAGGTVLHFGMPVDPGNLILLARIGAVTVLGLPGCARSPRLNGIDDVLRRLAAGLPVGGDVLMGLGVGGLLAETPTRPLPRAAAGPRAATGPRAPRIAAVVLAAGQSRRMGPVNKLLVPLDGVAMVRRVVETILASQARPVVVVTGHQPKAVEAALAGCGVTLVLNTDYAAGLSTSLRVGLGALPAEIDGALVCLGDMPLVEAATLDRLIAAYDPTEGRAICVPVAEGRRGNPVLWDKAFFAEMAAVTGDVGARHLIGVHADSVCEVAVAGAGVLLDIDTPEALRDLTT